MRRRDWLAHALGGAVLGVCGSPALGAATPAWPEWEAFLARFVQADGRVVDVTFDLKSTSEGQSYALFFALVANQRQRFDRLLEWTSNNLAAGQLGLRLPAWHWGRQAGGQWGVKDENSASDADLWIAYVLLEAARLWGAPAYAETGRRVLALIARNEVVDGGRAGQLLMPGAFGFALPRQRFRLNPSYLPGFMLRYLAQADPAGPWQAVWRDFEVLLPRAFAAGIAPDLFVVDSAGAVLPDTEAAPSASYDAIRVYLWAGLSGAAGLPIARRLARFATLTRELGRPPERVNPLTGVAVASDFSPIGFSGAVLPFLAALNEKAALAAQVDRIDAAAQRAARGEATNYYDIALLLFGRGWLEGRYRFDEGGRLLPRWAA